MKKQMALPWLDPAEQEEVCRALLRYELLKFSNDHNLPLKSGGTTDIYINMRDARNHPESIPYLAHLYKNPLLRLFVDRFAEVPDSVSCFAGYLSSLTGIPQLTIREEAKEGRVVKGKMIGSPRFGEKVCIIDDVITDGESKVIPYRECLKTGLVTDTLVVLVDRQQGWRQNFARQNISLNVWPGMTLHDVRKHLIRTLGIMERCNRQLEEKNPLIIALDGKSWEEFLPLLDELRTTGCIFKVNDMLWNDGIKNLIPDLHVYGRVMADIKGHDIKNTLENISRHFLKDPPWAVTVHASGGKEMIQATVQAFTGTPTKILAVTLLTSIDPKTCEEIYHRLPWDEARVLAAIAHRAGVHGFMCSAEEVKDLRALYPDTTLVTPGIRSEGADKHEQKRTGTPRVAMENGSDYLVMGRQISNNADPAKETLRVLKEELRII